MAPIVDISLWNRCLSPSRSLSEYLTACDERLASISFFTVSAGTISVTPEASNLCTDGDYFKKASMKLDSLVYCLMCMDENLSMDLYNTSHLSNLCLIEVHDTIKSYSAANYLRSAFPSTPATLFADLSTNFVDEVWAPDPVRVHALQ